MKSSVSSNRQVLDHLREIADDTHLDMELVSVAAGDRSPSADERRLLERERIARGPAFAADLLFALSHRYFSYEEADELWAGILRHKQQLAEAQGRDPGVSVATLDYLTNIQQRMSESTIIAEQKLETIADLAVRDRLTRLFDRATFESVLRHELRRYHRYGSTLSIIMADIDDFKQINDQLGHLRGDEVLRRMGRIISEGVRDVDVAGRFGGEEFIVVLPETEPQTALEIAERIRADVAAEFVDARPPVTVSGGVASCPTHGRSEMALLGAADKALYRAKASGKDRVLLAD